MVSIIISEYNTKVELLKESIKSLVNQSYENIELILIDDCGYNSDKLDNIVQSFNDNRIKLYKNESNKGLVFSLNRAIEISKGNYIARMDTDDYSYPNRIKEEMNFLLEHPEYDLVGSRCDFYDGSIIWGESKDYGDVTREKLLEGCPLVHPSVLYKKEAILSVGCYKDYKRSEDYATWIELYANNHKMFVLNKKLVRYHLSIDDYKKRTLKTRKGFLKLISSDYKKLNPTKLDLFKIRIKTIIAGIIPWKLMFTHHKKAFRIEQQ